MTNEKTNITEKINSVRQRKATLQIDIARVTLQTDTIEIKREKDPLKEPHFKTPHKDNATQDPSSVVREMLSLRQPMPTQYQVGQDQLLVESIRSQYNKECEATGLVPNEDFFENQYSLIWKKLSRDGHDTKELLEGILSDNQNRDMLMSVMTHSTPEKFAEILASEAPDIDLLRITKNKDGRNQTLMDVFDQKMGIKDEKGNILRKETPEETKKKDALFKVMEKEFRQRYDEETFPSSNPLNKDNITESVILSERYKDAVSGRNTMSNLKPNNYGSIPKDLLAHKR